jgi:hypothetical protein
MGPPGQLFAPTGTAATLVAGSVATASTDGTRLVMGTTSACGTGSSAIGCLVATGPFVLTDARALDRSRVTWFFTLPLASDCGAVTCGSGGFPPGGDGVDPIVGVSTYTTSGWQLPSFLSGGRYFIPADHRLCVCGVFTIYYGEPWRASWAGFVPYQ